jgi:curved DNA-binding protein CbpA
MYSILMMQDEHNYYDILGVTKSASHEEIRKAYRDLAKQCHPDRLSALPVDQQQALTEKMKRVTNAYTTLKDEKLRSEYDQQLLMRSPFTNRPNYGGSRYTYTYYRKPPRSPMASIFSSLIFIGVIALILVLIISFISVAWPILLILLLFSFLRSHLR